MGLRPTARADDRVSPMSRIQKRREEQILKITLITALVNLIRALTKLVTQLLEH